MTERSVPAGRAWTVEDILTTEELARRPSRAPDHAAEAAALGALAQGMVEAPREVLQRLAEAALWLCGAESAGVSVAERDGDEDIFRWRATAGVYGRWVGGTMPRAFSPCGAVVERDRTLLMADPARYYPYIDDLGAPIAEVLLVPFYRGGVAVGTVWLVSHTGERRFDGEDARMTASLARFAGAASGVLARVDAAEQYRHLFESIDEAFCVIEMIFDAAGRAVDYRFLETNPAFERHCGLADAAGRTIRQLVPDLEEVWFERYGRVARTGEPIRFEDRGVAMGGLWWNAYAFRIGGAGSRRVGILFSDITARKRDEQELRASDRRKDEFLATLAHELRNPLAPIRNGLTLLRAGDEVVQRDELLEMMERQLGQMVHLVDDLLDVSRVTTGKVTLRSERVPVGRIIDAAIETSRPSIEQFQHSLAVTQAAEELWVDADPTRLAQVLTNLLNNAAKYTPRRGRIAVEAAAEGDEVVLRVVDDGIGIAADMLPRVFDLFTQVGRSLESAHGGLGIGLSLARKLVEMHGGTVSVASAGLGCGSTFAVRLPRAARPAESATPACAGGAAALVPRRILVVDDNVDGAETLATLLSLLGHTTRTAFNGLTALEAAARMRPDVVLLDIGLPGMNGYEVAARLCEAEPPRPLLVAITGWGSDEDRRRAAMAGFDHHLTKPVDPEQVTALLACLE